MQDQSKNFKSLEWLPSPLISKIFAAAVREYQAETYDINAVVRAMIMDLDVVKQSDKQQQSTFDKKAHYQKQIIYFCSLLGGTPRYFIQLLNQQTLSSRTNIINISSQNHIIAHRFFKDFQIFGKTLTKFPDYLSVAEISKISQVYFNTVADKISKLYEQCSVMINNEMQRLTEKVKKSKMMNNFLLYKIFRQISDFCKIIVEDRATQSVFRHCQKEVIQQFFQYLINKFQIVKLSTTQEQSLTKNPMYSSAKFIKIVEYNQTIEITTKQAINSEGKFAIFLKIYTNDKSDNSYMDDYLILLNNDDELQVINCKTLRKKWFILGPLNTNLKFQSNNFKLSQHSRQYLLQAQKQLDAQRSNKNLPVSILFQGQPIDNYTNTNGVIGRCLYLMKKYTGVAEFFKDLSKRALISRSMEQIMYKIPIVGHMIFAGTFSASFYQIFSNRFSTQQRKLKQLGGLFINTGATVGTSILGAIAGQMFIPIPILGALIGTAIGGYLGDRGTKKISSVIENKRLAQIVEYLKESQINRRYWQYTKQLNELLEIKQSAFQKYLPGHLSQQAFTTLICFVLVCFYESRRLNKYNLEKVQAMGKSKSSSKKQYGAKGQDQFQAEVMKLNIDQNYQADFDITAIIDYLQQNSAAVYQHYDLIEKSILPFLNKIS